MSEPAQNDGRRDEAAPFDDATLATYRAALMAFLARRVSSRAEVEDLVQEALARLIFTASARDLREPQAYLFRIAGNLVTDLHRHRRARGGEPVALEEWHAPPVAPRQEERRHREDLQRLFEAALDELGPRCRQVFVLHKFDELSSWSIALKLKITPRMVQKHLAHAAAHLYDRLASHMESGR
ncbi:MAG: sigma-70 family RNA polymerase sigma factor [Sphingomonadales bacterium]|nr:MAG: sigma-70 family RNA polymerase sigma factor [Sphingomonadales bacterium]